MSVKGRIRAGVDTAFDQVGDIKETVTLVSESVTGFDHSTQKITKTSGTSVQVQALQISRIIDKKGRDKVEYLLKFEDVPINTYQTITTSTGTYTISKFEPTMDFIITVAAEKEN